MGGGGGGCAGGGGGGEYFYNAYDLSAAAQTEIRLTDKLVSGPTCDIVFNFLFPSLIAKQINSFTPTIIGTPGTVQKGYDERQSAETGTGS